jgi:hypothetical protein
LHLVGSTDLHILGRALHTLGLYEEVTAHLRRYRELVERVIDHLPATAYELPYHRLDLARANAEIARRDEVMRRVRSARP